MHYAILKSLHILSVVLFLGNIITGVFWKYHGDRIGTPGARAQALSGIISSDRWFTMPGVIAIIVTGVLLALALHLPILGTRWILWALILFGISGIAFQFFIAPLQKKLLALARAGETGAWNESEYRRLSAAWRQSVSPLSRKQRRLSKPVSSSIDANRSRRLPSRSLAIIIRPKVAAISPMVLRNNVAIRVGSWNGSVGGASPATADAALTAMPMAIRMKASAATRRLRKWSR